MDYNYYHTDHVVYGRWNWDRLCAGKIPLFLYLLFYDSVLEFPFPSNSCLFAFVEVDSTALFLYVAYMSGIIWYFSPFDLFKGDYV